MPITNRGTTKAIYEIVRSINPTGITSEMHLDAPDVYRAKYIASLNLRKLDDPIMFGVKKALGTLSYVGRFSGLYTDIDIHGMYQLPTKSKPEKIKQYILALPAEFGSESRTIHVEKQVALDSIVYHSLWLASQDSIRRNQIPEEFEKRLNTAFTTPQRAANNALHAALIMTSDVVITVKTFENENNILNLGNTATRMAVYGNTSNGMQRVTDAVPL
jgi:hypothetical protein